MKIPLLTEWTRRQQTRPRLPAPRTASLSTPQTDPRMPATATPTHSTSVDTTVFSTTLAGQDFAWTGTNKIQFHRYIRDHIPILSSAVWTWVHLCATSQTFLIEGPEQRKKEAAEILAAMDKRILDNITCRQPAVTYFIYQFLTELFTTGRYGASILPSPDGKNIRTIKQHNTDLIQWQLSDDHWIPYFEKDTTNPARSEKIFIDQETFFWATLQNDPNNPYGIETFSSIPFVAQIQEALAYDMAKSSHSAGTPRLHIRITPPVAFPHESEKQYQTRVNTYFDATVEAFNELKPEDIIFTWQDVDIKIIGGDTGRNFAWRLNREQIIEDVITGLHLYPWVLGRSHGTTKNWVESQFNVLMQVVETVQSTARGFADWIRNTELKLQGNPCITKHIFAPNQDPFITAKMAARRAEFDLLDLQVARGYIPKDESARRLGLQSAYKQDDAAPATSNKEQQ